MAIIVIPISQRSVFRVKDSLGIVVMETLLITSLLLSEALRPAMRISSSLHLALFVLGRPDICQRRFCDE